MVKRRELKYPTFFDFIAGEVYGDRIHGRRADRPAGEVFCDLSTLRMPAARDEVGPLCLAEFMKRIGDKVNEISSGDQDAPGESTKLDVFESTRRFIRNYPFSPYFIDEPAGTPGISDGELKEFENIVGSENGRSSAACIFMRWSINMLRVREHLEDIRSSYEMAHWGSHSSLLLLPFNKVSPVVSGFFMVESIERLKRNRGVGRRVMAADGMGEAFRLLESFFQELVTPKENDIKEHLERLGRLSRFVRYADNPLGVKWASLGDGAA